MTTNNFTLRGVDIFVETKLGAKLPESVGSLKLLHIASRGLKIDPSAETTMLDVGWVCARYSFASAIVGNGDNEISALISAIGSKYNWTSLVKLFDDAGKPAYT